MKVCLTFFALLISNLVFCQSQSGIFLSIKCSRSIPKHRIMLTDKQVCLASQPFILPAYFDGVSEVRQKDESIFFDLTLSVQAQQRLRMLAANLPESNFALVVDGDVFSVFPAADLLVNRTFRFEGKMESQQDFFSIQEKIKSLINGSTQ